ncbi:MAG: 16S rRNA (cytosine(967)-C(5))-methyltransferase RsmB [Christensenellales bacterium]
MISARRAAYDALTAITKNGAYTALALKEHIPGGLPNEDKKFASMLVRTTLENLLRIDYALNQQIRSKRVHGSVRNILRLGACQILYMNVEDYAAVSESVKLMKQLKPQMSGFVNAVLRTLIRNKYSIIYPRGENVQALSIAYSYPIWICEKFVSDFGFDFTKALFSYSAQKGTAVRMNPLRTDPVAFEQELDALGFDFEQGSIAHSYTIKGLSDIENLNVYKKGWIAIQSESAMRAVIQTGIRHGDRLLDCCAAPGGKSAYAAALADNTLDILAFDIHPHRVKMTMKNYERLAVKKTRVKKHDASIFEPCLAKAFDVVIVDAPCSAMGLMAKNPDIRYIRTLNDIAELSNKQYDILSTCARYVKAGGTLAYYTCSINREENEQVTDKFINNHAGYEYKYEPMTLYPHIHGSDGFYIAVIQRKS